MGALLEIFACSSERARVPCCRERSAIGRGIALRFIYMVTGASSEKQELAPKNKLTSIYCECKSNGGYVEVAPNY